jgi:hypothetical protein
MCSLDKIHLKLFYSYQHNTPIKFFIFLARPLNNTKFFIFFKLFKFSDWKNLKEFLCQ